MSGLGSGLGLSGLDIRGPTLTTANMQPRQGSLDTQPSLREGEPMESYGSRTLAPGVAFRPSDEQPSTPVSAAPVQTFTHRGRSHSTCSLCTVVIPAWDLWLGLFALFSAVPCRVCALPVQRLATDSYVLRYL